MLIIIVMLVTFVSSPVFFISGTALSSLFQRKLLVPSWYFGYDATKDKSILNYLLVWLFQVIGLAGGAAMNVGPSLDCAIYKNDEMEFNFR